jgi:hypothetical protein
LRRALLGGLADLHVREVLSKEEEVMIVIGADSHKRTHTLVAVDDVGRRLAEKTVRTNTEGHLDLLGWSRRLPGADAGEVRFALEDCRHLTRRLRPARWWGSGGSGADPVDGRGPEGGP